ncbi:hypothetical protein JCM8208_006389 [Rhodotorula glutinis]
MPPAPARAKRLARELQECRKDDDIDVVQVGDSIDHFLGSFNGPTGTAYERGRFEVDIVAPDRYPFEPLKVKFITKVYHPNISSASGYICLDILNKSWSPVYTLRTCLVSLQALLSSPEPTDPQDAEVAKHYLTDRKSFEATAKFWTESYATPRPPSTTRTPAPAPDAPSTTSRSRSSSRRRGGGGAPGSAGRASDEERKDEGRAARRRRVAQEQEEEEEEGHREEEKEERTDGPKTLARLAGLDYRDVQAFSDMGFPPERVVDTLKFLNYRDGNKANVGEEAVVVRLMG